MLVVSCRQSDGTWVLAGLWRRLGIDELIRKLVGAGSSGAIRWAGRRPARLPGRGSAPTPPGSVVRPGKQAGREWVVAVRSSG